MNLPGLIAAIQWAWWISIPLMLLIITAEVILLCFRHIARRVPTNYIILLVFTLAEAYLVGLACSYYSKDAVITSASCTALITLSVTIYALFTSTDFTWMRGIFWVFGMTIIMFSLFAFLIYPNQLIYNLINALVLLLFGLFLIFDTQLIQGHGKNKLSIDDYIIGALLLYIDIITIFLDLLKLCGRR